jgi:serine phosphatase RsbU (regulator of sigma subunit)
MPASNATNEPSLNAFKRLPSARAVFWQCVLAALIAFAVLAGISGLVYGLSKEALITEIRDGLSRTARIGAASVNGDQHRVFVSPEQETLAEYQSAIHPLRDIMDADSQIAFAYSAIIRDDAVYFVLDATPMPAPGLGIADDSVKIMEKYDPPPPELLRALLKRQVTVTKEPYTDKWGTFISAYAPIYDSNRVFVGAVGVDLKIDNYQRRLKSIQWVSYLATVISAIVAIVIGLALFWQKKTDRNIIELKRQFRIVNGLLNVSRAVGSNVGLENILPILVSKTNEVMNAQSTHLYLLDAKKQFFNRWHQENIKLSATSGLMGRIYKSETLVNLENASADLDFSSEQSARPVEAISSLIVCPIRSNRGEVIAVLESQNRFGGLAFDGDDETLLAALSSQAQVALEREKLAQLAIEKRQLEQSLKFAQTIQMGMLPKVPTDWRTRGIDLCAHLVPAKIVGGDFYDFFQIEDGRIALVIADVSGKGVPAALFMAKAMTLIRAFAIVGKPPAEVLRAANEELVNDNAAAMFVTVFIALFDLQTGILTYANGGHNAPLLLREGVVAELSDALAVPLGTLGGMGFEEATIRLQRMDLLYLFTDGVNESMNTANEELGDARLHALVRQLTTCEAQNGVDETLKLVTTHAGAEPQSDDITLLLVRWLGAPSDLTTVPRLP